MLNIIFLINSAFLFICNQILLEHIVSFDILSFKEVPLVKEHLVDDESSVEKERESKYY